MNKSTLQSLDDFRHKIPFWWWLTYDAIAGLVIIVGVSPHKPVFWLGLGVLFIAVVIDVVEFIVKRPSARAKLEEE
jgi:hypothetical protein